MYTEAAVDSDLWRRRTVALRIIGKFMEFERAEKLTMRVDWI